MSIQQQAQIGLDASLTAAIANAQILNDTHIADRLLEIKRDALKARDARPEFVGR